jgi:type I restriction enzyme S subunit
MCDFIRGPFGGSLTKSIFKPSGYVIYEQRHAIYGDFSEFRYFVDEKKYSEMKRFAVSPKDILVSCSGTMGRASVVPEDAPKGIINQALLKLAIKKGLLIDYLKYWLDSEIFQDLISENSGGSAIKNVASVKILRGLPIAVPTEKEQEKIVKRLDAEFAKVGKLKELYAEKLAKITKLKQSTLAEAFMLSN